jgi:dUTP pyrophosphatase
MNKLQVLKHHPDAKIPVRGSSLSAAYDLFSVEDGQISPREKGVVDTGISIFMPRISEPYKIYGSIRSRSGLSFKHNIEVGAGVIDCDYTGVIKVMLYNHSDKVFSYSKGDRIAQLILELHITPDVLEVYELDKIQDNERGNNGFGSTGK